MKKYLFIALGLFIAGCSITTSTPTFKLITNQVNYKEYSFYPDTNAGETSTTIAEVIHAQATALSYEADQVTINDTEKRSGSISQNDGLSIATNDQEYTLQLVDKATDTYAVYADDTKLFERKMCWPAELAEGDPEMYTVNERLVVKFFECEQTKQAGDTAIAGTYTSNIYYDGQFLNENYQINNAEFVFVWDNKIGFIAQDGNDYYVWFNGKKISPGFSWMNIKNCCAYFELTPTLYDNGTLMFYGQRASDGTSVIAELHLE